MQFISAMTDALLGPSEHGAATKIAWTRTQWALIVLAACIATAGIVWQWDFFFDDAYITLRYVQRLLAGKGLSWTGGPPVEGFTHPLWIFQSAALAAIGVPLEYTVRVLGILYLAGLFALWRYFRLNPLLLLVLTVNIGVIRWTIGGVETMSFAFWITAGYLLILRVDSAKNHAAGMAAICFAAAGLTRPEGIAVGGLAFFVLLESRNLRRAAVFALIFIAPIAAYEAFRLAYFGDYLPNSARVKLYGLPLLWRGELAFNYLLEHVWIWLPALGVFIASARESASRRISAALLLILPLLVSIVSAGGDHMVSGRFFVPIIVMLAASAAMIHDMSPRHRQVMASIGIMAVIVSLMVLASQDQHRDLAGGPGRLGGAFMAQYLPAGSLVATASAGGFAFAAPDLEFIDSLGLNTREIGSRKLGMDDFCCVFQYMPGHSKGDGAFILNKKPDVIILGPTLGYSAVNDRQWYLTDYELLNTPAFHQHYTHYVFKLPVPAGFSAFPGVEHNPDGSAFTYFFAWLRNDSLRVKNLAAVGRPLPPRGAAPRAPTP